MQFDTCKKNTEGEEPCSGSIEKDISWHLNTEQNGRDGGLNMGQFCWLFSWDLNTRQ